MHAPAFIAHALARHLGMHDAAPCGHPLDVAGRELAAVAGRILVLELAVEQIRDGLKAAMRMVRGADRLAGRIVHRPHLVQQEERVELRHFGRGERAADDEAAAFDGAPRADDAGGLAQDGLGHGL